MYEYERRFLVPDLDGVLTGTPTTIVQGYLWESDGYCVRVRRRYVPGDDGAYYEAQPTCAVKGPRSAARRREYEVPIDVDTARELLRRTSYKVVKDRYQVVGSQTLWDVDVFHWDNKGLVIAECEGRTPMDKVEVPDWCGPEVTDDRRYDNERLAARPFVTWRKEP